MIFPSYIFLLGFLPLILLAWYRVPNLQLRLIILTLASYFFYGWWDYRFVALMFGSTLLDYACGKHIAAATTSSGRKFGLYLSLVGNLTSLGFFKYFDFFVESAVGALHAVGLEANPPLLHVILPIGISFYTFQSMSYSIDIYRGDCRPARDFTRFAAYVSMFPQLVAGPIVRYQDIHDQLDDLETKVITPEEQVEGVWLFVVGLVKKIWIADTLARGATLTFDGGTSPQLALAWAGSLCYTFQLYFDFSGYSDMARGLGLLLGFRFPPNFDSPYKSANIAEFWNRWHISLSNWLRDYLYIPLGGSRHGMNKTLRNLGLTMFLGGLWHGAGWTFVVWGLLHGAYLIIQAAWRKILKKRMNRRLGIPLTFFAVVLGWVFFRAPSLSAAGGVLWAMLGGHGVEKLTYIRHGVAMPSSFAGLGLKPLVALVLAAGIAFFAPNSQDFRFKPTRRWAAGMALATVITLTLLAAETPFLYFQF